MNPIQMLLMSRSKVYRSDCPDKAERKTMPFNAEEALGLIIEEWKRDGFDQPWEQSIKKLGVKIIDALHWAYEEGRSDGIKWMMAVDDDEEEDEEVDL